ncbi:MAG: class I SAM-dependent methyltransferase [Chitinophagaceae bacterium]|nr:MAG: class I SAM-dependent methyltransferase [Chitinophagaceae bacterium]
MSKTNHLRLFTKDDFIDIREKFYEKGGAYFLTKLNLSPANRTKSTFSQHTHSGSNFWIIPELQERWKIKISGSKEESYEAYVIDKFLKDKSDVTLLSLGSGTSQREFNFASNPVFKEVECIDLSESLMEYAYEKSIEKGLTNMSFKASDINKMKFKEDHYDVVLFHSSLHHFKHVFQLLQKIKACLKENGILVIHDYAGPKRLQWTQKQIDFTNDLLNNTPEKYKKRLHSEKIKSKVSGPGALRMIISDPSEAVESNNIRPALEKYFKTIEEKELGGNIVMLYFKDIAHNFLNDDEETKQLLKYIFEKEDEFLKSEPSNLIFGVYSK